MLFVLLIIPALASLSALLMYRLTGRRELLKFDFIQFIYAFVYAPVFFIWGKSFLFLLLRQEENIQLSLNQIFIVDTIFSVFLLYIFAFAVIKSLTKSFDLKKKQDPFFDIHELAEYFHNFFSHFIMYSGMLIALAVVSIANLFFPLELELSRPAMYLIGLGGSALGFFLNLSIWLYEADQHERLTRLMKLHYIVLFLLHVVLYFWLNPSFSGEYAPYWFVFLGIVTAGLSSWLERSKKVEGFFGKFYPQLGRKLDSKKS